MTNFAIPQPVDIRLRINTASDDLLGIASDYQSMNGAVVSSNFPGFRAGREYALTLSLWRLGANSLGFGASWLDTVTGGVYSNAATNSSATNFVFDGLSIWTESAATTAENITLMEFQVDYLPKAAEGLPDIGNAQIYFTLDGSTPTTESTRYTGPVRVATASTVRARAFADDWTASEASVAYYGHRATPSDTRVTRFVNMTTPTAPLIGFNVTPAKDVKCLTLTESLPLGLAALNVTEGGHYVANQNVVHWGPFIGTNSLVLTYQAVGSPGTYPLHASWSVDGVGAIEPAETNITVACDGDCEPRPPPMVATPVFSPPSGDVPVDVTISCATAGAAIHYTLDGMVPTTSSPMYSAPVRLGTISTVRARAFANGWTPSVASVADYGPIATGPDVRVTRSVNLGNPSGPVVTVEVSPGNNATCIAVTETLPPGVSVQNVTAGGSYSADNNMILWGPFFGPGVRTLRYEARGSAGNHPTQLSWSVDGVGGSENGSIPITSNDLPPPPTRVPTPDLTPSSASGLPISVTMTCSDADAQLFFTTDGSLPTQGSTPYTDPLWISQPTTVRVRAVRARHEPSVVAVADYVAPPTTTSLLVVRSVVDNGTLIPKIDLTAVPQGSLACYSVTEEVALGLTPSGLVPDAAWDPFKREIRWGPYLDNQRRDLSYIVGGATGGYPLAGEGSFDGFPSSVSGAMNVVVNAEYWGSPNTSSTVCYTNPFTYIPTFDPIPGVLIIDSITGLVDWGDGSSAAVTQQTMTFQKRYGAVGTYLISVAVDWTGHIDSLPWSGHSTRSDTVFAVTCDPPRIVTQPQPASQTVLQGGIAQISVNATSHFPMTYQWYLNQNNPIVSPATFQTLRLEDVRVESAGPYSVVITNSFGSVTSDFARVMVLVPVVRNITQNPDGSVTLGFSGLPNSTTRTWTATNLQPPIFWQPISTNSVGPSGTWQIIDTGAPFHPGRFYRFSTP